MTIKSSKQNHLVNQKLVSQFKNLTNNFEEQLSELILPAVNLKIEDKKQIEVELQATIQNINFMITSLFVSEIND